MRLSDRGEFAWIDRIARIARAAGSPGAGVPLGIGDDAALLRPRAGEDVAVSTDAAVEGVHFRWQQQSPATLGRRCVAAAVSDLAAMGARPLGLLVAVAAPPALTEAQILGLARGLARHAADCEAPLVGGNLTRARETVITCTAVGAVRRGRALRRDAARPGDRLLVTGAFGASALELARAERGAGRVRRVPPSRLAAGRALARQRFAGACIDVSDGLLADLGHVLAASGVGAEVDLARVPTPRGFTAACAKLGLDPRVLASSGGEDYELLFSVRPDAPSAEVLSRRLGTTLREIGVVTRGRRLAVRGGAAPGRQGSRAAPGGWRHF